MRRAAFGLKRSMFFAGKGFPAGEWNGYYQQASSFGDKGQLVRGSTPETPHERMDFVCTNCCFSSSASCSAGCLESP